MCGHPLILAAARTRGMHSFYRIGFSGPARRISLNSSAHRMDPCVEARRVAVCGGHERLRTNYRLSRKCKLKRLILIKRSVDLRTRDPCVFVSDLMSIFDAYSNRSSRWNNNACLGGLCSYEWFIDINFQQMKKYLTAIISLILATL